MANPVRGEVALGRAYLRYTTNAMCEFEAVVGKSLVQAAQELEDDPRVGAIRDLVFYGLKSWDPQVTPEAAGDLMDEVGIGAAIEAMGKAIRLAFPSVEPAKEPAGKH